MTLILSNEDINALLTMPECIATLEEAYRELAFGRGTNRRRADSLVPTANKSRRLICAQDHGWHRAQARCERRAH